MKTQSKLESLFATHCQPAMLAVHQAEVTLQDQLLHVWDLINDGSVSIPQFRKEFVTFAVANGYCERWAKMTLTDSGFRLRAERSDKGAARKPAKADKPAKVDKPAKAGSALDRFVAAIEAAKKEMTAAELKLARMALASF